MLIRELTLRTGCERVLRVLASKFKVGVLVALSTALYVGLLATPVHAQNKAGKVVEVQASAQTEPVTSTGDAADDVAIWVNSTDATQSRIVASDKKGGVVVFGLDGATIQSLKVGRINNIDLRSGVLVDGKPRVLVVGSDRDSNALRLWLMNEDNGTLVDAPGTKTTIGLVEPYGMCLAQVQTPRGLATYAFTSNRDGKVVQHELVMEAGVFVARLVRTIEFSSEVEGLVADDAMGVVYASEEDVGVWRLPLVSNDIATPGTEPDATKPISIRLSPQEGAQADKSKGSAYVLIARTGADQPLKADVEGIAIYVTGNNSRAAQATGLDSGVIIVSSQGSSTFAVYELALTNHYVGSFRVVGATGIDAVDETDGVDATSASLGALYPFGLLVVQDGSASGKNQNFKLIGWEKVAKEFEPRLPRGSARP